MMIRTLIFALTLAIAAPASAASTTPVKVRVLRVTDGDTFSIDLPFAPFTELPPFKVRILGIDTPEHGGRAKCKAEAVKAELATTELARLIQDSDGLVTLTNVSHDKYGGRLDATVTLANGADVSTAMINKGLARAYDGGKKSSWCVKAR